MTRALIVPSSIARDPGNLPPGETVVVLHEGLQSDRAELLEHFRTHPGYDTRPIAALYIAPTLCEALSLAESDNWTR